MSEKKINPDIPTPVTLPKGMTVVRSQAIPSTDRKFIIFSFNQREALGIYSVDAHPDLSGILVSFLEHSFHDAVTRVSKMIVTVDGNKYKGTSPEKNVAHIFLLVPLDVTDERVKDYLSLMKQRTGQMLRGEC